jgi:putative FmdB family regulatory protein
LENKEEVSRELVTREVVMPIYEYDCADCGVVEVIQRFSDAALEQCPQCADKGVNSPVARMLSVSAFHLKGGGWYKTDYASSGRAGGGSSASGAATKGADSSADSSGSSGSSESSSSSSSSSSESSSGSSSGGGCGSSCGCH